ncbi:MAG: response regulator, partial [Bacteroidales bacterium]|nr:response regulator [Bacteroidales bacterium]
MSLEETLTMPVDASINLNGKVFMLVEDVISNYQLLYAYFNKSGVQIIHVDNGLDAVNIIKNNIPVDLIIMDIRLPKMGGLEATALIKSMRSDIPIIAQTAFAMQADRERCM